MNPPTEAISASQTPRPQRISLEEAKRTKVYFRWREQIENATGSEDIGQRTFCYCGKKFIWGNNDQEEVANRLLRLIITKKFNNDTQNRNKNGEPKRRRRDLDEALPFVENKPKYNKWVTLPKNETMEYNGRVYTKGFDEDQRKLVTSIMNVAINNERRRKKQRASNDDDEDNCKNDVKGTELQIHVSAGGGGGGEGVVSAPNRGTSNVATETESETATATMSVSGGEKSLPRFSATTRYTSITEGLTADEAEMTRNARLDDADAFVESEKRIPSSLTIAKATAKTMMTTEKRPIEPSSLGEGRPRRTRKPTSRYVDHIEITRPKRKSSSRRKGKWNVNKMWNLTNLHFQDPDTYLIDFLVRLSGSSLTEAYISIIDPNTTEAMLSVSTSAGKREESEGVPQPIDSPVIDSSVDWKLLKFVSSRDDGNDGDNVTEDVSEEKDFEREDFFKELDTLKLLTSTEETEEESEPWFLEELKMKQAELISLESSIKTIAKGVLSGVNDEYTTIVSKREKRILNEKREAEYLAAQRDLDKVELAWHGPIDQEDKAVCDVCSFEGDDPRDNKLIFCDACNVAAHQKCFGVDQIPHGNFFCNPCSYFEIDKKYLAAKRRDGPSMKTTAAIVCEVCPRRKGAFVQVQTSGPTKKAKWAHVKCAKSIRATYRGMSSMAGVGSGGSTTTTTTTTNLHLAMRSTQQANAPMQLHAGTKVSSSSEDAANALLLLYKTEAASRS
jgi:hypothetical protein